MIKNIYTKSLLTIALLGYAATSMATVTTDLLHTLNVDSKTCQKISSLITSKKYNDVFQAIYNRSGLFTQDDEVKKLANGDYHRGKALAPEARLKQGFIDQKPFLYTLIEAREFKLAKKVIEKGKKTNCKDFLNFSFRSLSKTFNQTALHLELNQANPDLDFVTYLVETDLIDLKRENKEGKTALRLAIEKQNMCIWQYLLAKGAKCDPLWVKEAAYNYIINGEDMPFEIFKDTVKSATQETIGGLVLMLNPIKLGKKQKDRALKIFELLGKTKIDTTKTKEELTKKNITLNTTMTDLLKATEKVESDPKPANNGDPKPGENTNQWTTSEKTGAAVAGVVTTIAVGYGFKKLLAMWQEKDKKEQEAKAKRAALAEKKRNI